MTGAQAIPEHNAPGPRLRLAIVRDPAGEWLATVTPASLAGYWSFHWRSGRYENVSSYAAMQERLAREGFDDAHSVELLIFGPVELALS